MSFTLACGPLQRILEVVEIFFFSRGWSDGDLELALKWREILSRKN